MKQEKNKQKLPGVAVPEREIMPRVNIPHIYEGIWKNGTRGFAQKGSESSKSQMFTRTKS